MWELIRQATAQFAEAGVPSPAVDARLIAEHVLGQRPTPLIEATPQQQARFLELAAMRAKRVPLQHVIGKAWFRYLELEARPGVFIARPETEMMVQAAVDELSGAQWARGEDAPVVVDLCTGSGAIAISLAYETDARVYAVELSEVAIQSARRNSARYGDKVTFVQGDALEALPELEGRVDIVISNPPYVPPWVDLPPEVRHDPPMALFGGGPDGLDFPRKLLARAAGLLKPGGILFMEHSDEQGKALRDEATSTGWVSVTTGRDLAGRERWLQARRVEPARGGTVPAAGVPASVPRAQDGAPAQARRWRERNAMIVDFDSPQLIELARQAVTGGKVICLPTDTVYGIGCDPFNYDAVSALLAAKFRTRAFPPPVLVADFEQAERLGQMNDAARALARKFWPGALTIVIPAADNIGWDLGETNGTVALRMPNSPVAIQLLKELGPLAVTSANVHGQPPANTATEAREQLGDSVALYVDAGRRGGGVASTIVQTVGEIKILREGAISPADVDEALAGAQ